MFLITTLIYLTTLFRLYIHDKGWKYIMNTDQRMSYYFDCHVFIMYNRRISMKQFNEDSHLSLVRIRCLIRLMIPHDVAIFHWINWKTQMCLARFLFCWHQTRIIPVKNARHDLFPHIFFRMLRWMNKRTLNEPSETVLCLKTWNIGFLACMHLSYISTSIYIYIYLESQENGTIKVTDFKTIWMYQALPTLNPMNRRSKQKTIWIR